jgi:hypothetical protein
VSNGILRFPPPVWQCADDTGGDIREIQRLRLATPFQPIRVLTADAQAYDVRLPEYVGHTPSGRRITIGLDDDSTVTLDLLLATAIQKPLRRRRRR